MNSAEQGRSSISVYETPTGIASVIVFFLPDAYTARNGSNEIYTYAEIDNGRKLAGFDAKISETMKLWLMHRTSEVGAATVFVRFGRFIGRCVRTRSVYLGHMDNQVGRFGLILENSRNVRIFTTLLRNINTKR